MNIDRLDSKYYMGSEAILDKFYSPKAVNDRDKSLRNGDYRKVNLDMFSLDSLTERSMVLKSLLITSDTVKPYSTIISRAVSKVGEEKVFVDFHVDLFAVLNIDSGKFLCGGKFVFDEIPHIELISENEYRKTLMKYRIPRFGYFTQMKDVKKEETMKYETMKYETMKYEKMKCEMITFGGNRNE